MLSSCYVVGCLFAQNILISTPATSLVLSAPEKGELKYIYYGAKLSDRDFQTIGSLDKGKYAAYPVYGLNCPSEVALAVKHNDGNMTLQLEVVKVESSHQDEANLTIISLKDKVYPFYVKMFYKAYQDTDIIEIWSEISHQEKKTVVLNQFASAYLPIRKGDVWLSHLYGAWANEGRLEEVPLEAGMKVIKNKDVSEEEYAYISENIDNLKGFNTKLDWERVYLYGDTFKSILGNVSSNNQGIPSELAEIYLKKGYSLDDRVGISYLEYQYENYLKGTKAKYRLLSDNSYELVSEGKRGSDIVLTIDINLQKHLEEILSNEVYNAKGEAGTTYYNRSFAVIADPNTGEILAMGGKQVLDKDGSKYIVDYTPGIATLPVTPGSVVKGASMMVGYKYGAIDIGSHQYDECLKIKDTPLKCSWRTMGDIDDIYALAFSSNVYQYKIAITVGKGKYEYDKGLSLDEEAFKKYRDMYAEFGLGKKTGIDLPVESLGYMGTSKLPGHLLDFSIGQYDTYTPIQLSQYINTIANGGKRLKPYLLKEVYKASDNGDKFGSLIYKAETKVMGTLSVEDKYINRVREGFSAVVQNGLGYGYMGYYTNSAGKTGTSQSFIDTDGDNKVDTETITTSFVGYSPSDSPKMSIVVVSPDAGIPDVTQSGVTKRISSQIVNKFFELNQ